MTASPLRSLPARLAALPLALLLGLGIVALAAEPAAAHDQLISSDPADGSSVDELPAQVSLAYSAVVFDAPGSTVIEVSDAAGHLLNDGDAVQDQNVITQPLAGDATGPITVKWKVVSSDGHPVSGEVTFTVTGSAPPADPTSSAQPEPTATAPAEQPSDAGGGLVAWIAGGALAAAAIVVAVVLLAVRARQQRAVAAERTAGRDDPAGR